MGDTETHDDDDPSRPETKLEAEEREDEAGDGSTTLAAVVEHGSQEAEPTTTALEHNNSSRSIAAEEDGDGEAATATKEETVAANGLVVVPQPKQEDEMNTQEEEDEMEMDQQEQQQQQQPASENGKEEEEQQQQQQQPPTSDEEEQLLEEEEEEEDATASSNPSPNHENGNHENSNNNNDDHHDDDDEMADLGYSPPQLQAIHYGIVKPPAPEGPPYSARDVTAFVAQSAQVLKHAPRHMETLVALERNLPEQGAQADQLSDNVQQLQIDIQASVAYIERELKTLESYLGNERKSTQSNLADLEALDLATMDESQLSRHLEILEEDRQAMEVGMAFYQNNHNHNDDNGTDPPAAADEYAQLVERIDAARTKVETAMAAAANNGTVAANPDEEEGDNENAAFDENVDYGYEDTDVANVDYGYEDADDKAGDNVDDEHDENNANDENVDDDDEEEEEEEMNAADVSAESEEEEEEEMNAADVSAESEEPYPEYMGEFFEEIDCINDDIDVIKEATLAITSLNETALNVTDNEGDLTMLEEQMGPLVDTTNKQAQRAKDSLSQLKNETKELDEGEVMLCHLYSENDIRTRKNEVNKLSRSFINEMKMFQSVQESFKADIKRKRQSLSAARKKEQLQREMEEFYRDVGSVKDDIDSIESATMEIQGYNDGLAWRDSTEKDEAALEAKVATLVEQTNKRATRTKSSLSRLKERTAELEEGDDDEEARLPDSDLRTRKNVLNLQSRKFISAMHLNQDAQREFKASVEEKRMARAKEAEKEEEEEPTNSANRVEVEPLPLAPTADLTSESSVGEEEFVYPRVPIARRTREIFSPNVWWMVDLSPCYDHDEETHQQGATPLVRRCIQAYDWTPEHARRVLKAYRQFFAMKKELQDWNGNSDGFAVIPCTEVWKMWKEHIVDMDNYFLDCKLLVGHVLRYSAQPYYDDQDDEMRADLESRRKFTHQKMKLRFGDRFDEELWGYDPNTKLGRFSSLRSFASSNRRLSAK